MGLFQPAWMSDVTEKALKAVERINNQSKLHKIAKTAPSPSARGVAVRKLTDQTALADVAKHIDDKYCFDVPEIAAKKITDQNMLADVAKNSIYPHARFIAAEKLTDQTLAQKTYLDIVNEGGFDYELRFMAAEKLTDQTLAQKTYFDVSKNYYKRDMPSRTVKRITDQAMLADLAKNASTLEARFAAVDALTDQALLADVAKKGHDYRLRMNAADKLTDQTLAQKIYADLAKKATGYADAEEKKGTPIYGISYRGDNPERRLRLEAIGKITDQALLVDVAKNAAGLDETEMAIDKITDQSLLFHLAKSGGGSAERNTAAKKITDQAVLANLAKNSKDVSVRVKAALKLTDQTLAQETYAYVAKTINIYSGDWYARLLAVEKLTDQETLAYVAKNDSEDLVRNAANRRLQELQDSAVKTDNL